jgi:hypothetical protein
VGYLAIPEQWRAIPGLEGFYDASSHGRIRRASGRIRQPYPNGKYGRLMVLLSVNGERTNCYVGALVARTFIGPRPPGQHVCHGPAGQSDCSPDNIYYGSPRRNTHDRKRDGTWMAGEQNGRAKLTWVLVREIRRRHKAGERQKDLAAEFGMARSVISGIIRGEIWVDDQPPTMNI